MDTIAVRMREALLLAMFVLGPCVAQADSLTITDQNASLKFTRNDPGTPLGIPSDPVQLPQTLEWTVDGRRILVYPSAPSSWLDISHLHPGGHVTASQIHAQGPMIGYGTSASDGTVVGGIVYSVEGSAADSGTSRIWEKVDIVNKTTTAVSLSLAGMGWKPQGGPHQSGLEVPDWTGLNVTGTTTVFLQGSADSGASIHSSPYGPVTVLPVVSFSGFNPMSQGISLPAGATLTVVTELKVAP